MQCHDIVINYAHRYILLFKYILNLTLIEMAEKTPPEWRFLFNLSPEEIHELLYGC